MYLNMTRKITANEFSRYFSRNAENIVNDITSDDHNFVDYILLRCLLLVRNVDVLMRMIYIF